MSDDKVTEEIVEQERTGPVLVPIGEESENDKPGREPERWPMSEASKLIVDASNESLEAARERFNEADARHRSRIVSAMRIDGLPTEVGPPRFLGAKREGDEWVEMFREDLQRR